MNCPHCQHSLPLYRVPLCPHCGEVISADLFAAGSQTATFITPSGEAAPIELPETFPPEAASVSESGSFSLPGESQRNTATFLRGSPPDDDLFLGPQQGPDTVTREADTVPAAVGTTVISGANPPGDGDAIAVAGGDEESNPSGPTYIARTPDGRELVAALSTREDGSETPAAATFISEPDEDLARTADSSPSASRSTASLESIPRRSMIDLRHVDAAPAATPDYELHRVLGEGGMGTVWAARQTSVDRFVALKTIKGRAARDRGTLQKFLEEAVITGDLEHPNIVPIHEIGTTLGGGLFYSMKQVQGTPWNKVIRKKTLHENLEILLRTADAVAFAHSRGIIHRDLKPQNVMLGSFGEVLVMDWGLALPTSEFTKCKSDMPPVIGGTPAYMAPEMAEGPIERITFASDIYLLGAILFQIITHKHAHPGKNGSECFRNVVTNVLNETEETGELIDIAYRAMQTNPADRFGSVQEFQQAIRDHLSHNESVAMSVRAQEDLAAGTKTRDYTALNKAIFGFEEAAELWSGNAEAKAGVARAKRAYAQAAYDKGDFDLGLSLVDGADSEFVPLATRLRAARDEREARQRRLVVARRVMAGMAAAIFLIVGVSLVWIRSERNYAIAQRDEAKIQEGKAREQEGVAKKNELEALRLFKVAETERVRANEQAEIAETQKMDALRQKMNAQAQERIALEQKVRAETQEKLALQEKAKAEKEKANAEQQEKIALQEKAKAELEKANAVKQEQLALQQKKVAEEQRALAVSAREAEAYEAYTNRIGLAAAKIDENSFDVAEQLLAACPPELRNWEWGRLMHLCRQESKEFPAEAAVASVAYSPDGQLLATGSWDRKGRIWELATGKLLHELPHAGLYVHSVAWSPDGKILATGGSLPSQSVTLWNAATGERLADLPGHRDAVSHVVFSQSGTWLLTTSFDNDARLWDVRDPKRPVLASILEEHTWWVLGGAMSPGFDPADPARGSRIITTGQDGKVLVWRFEADSTRSGTYTARVAGRFTGHDGPVLAASFHPIGSEVATAGHDRLIRRWNPDRLTPKSSREESDAATSGLAALSGHSAPVQALHYSDDGSLLVSGGKDNLVKVWDLDREKTLKTLRGHSSGVRSVAISPDGRTIASGGTDRRAIVWNVGEYEEFRVLEGHADSILDAVFSPDGRQILTASRDRTARIWDKQTGRELQVFQEGHEYLASRVEAFRDGRSLATSAADGSVRLWDVATGSQFLRLPETGRSAALALSGDNRWLATGTEDDGVQVWDLRPLQRDIAAEVPAVRPKSVVLQGHQTRVTAARFSPDQPLLVTADAAGRCTLHRIDETGTPKALWSVLHHTLEVTDVAFLPDGRILSASLDHTVACLDPKDGRELDGDNLKPRAAVTVLAVSRDGKRIATVCPLGESEEETGSRVAIWNASGGKLVLALEVPSIGITSIEFSPDGNRLLVAASDRTIRSVDLTQTTVIVPEPLIDLRRERGIVWAARYMPDGRSIVSIGGSDARLWDAETARESMTFGPHGAVASARFSPDGTRVITGSWDNTARIWSVKSGRSIVQLEQKHTGYINSAVFSPSGKEVLTASDDRTARLWDARTGTLRKTLRGHLDRVRSAVYSADGQMIATASNDKTIRLWRADTGEAIGEPLEGHTWAVRAVQFSADGKRLLSAGEDNEARLWDLEGRQVIGVFRGHTSPITSVTFLRDGRRVMTASQDSTVKLWDAAPGHEGKEILTLRGHSQEVTAVNLSSDGRTVLTAGRDARAILWPAAHWLPEKEVASSAD